MSIAAPSAFTSSGGRSVSAQSPNVEFEQLWAASKARGLIHERAVRRRFLVVTVIIVAITVASLMAFGLLLS